MKRMRFYVGLIALSLISAPIYAQNERQSNIDTTAKRKTIGSLNGAPINQQFKGQVYFDGKVLENGLQSISSLPVDTIRTITYIRGFYSLDSLIKYGPAAANGIIILNTSKDSIRLPGSVN